MATRFFRKMAALGIMAIGAIGAAALPGHAAYSYYGSGMDVLIGSVENAELNVQCAGGLWLGTSQASQTTTTYTNSFAGIACDDYAGAWLVTAVYGAVATNTAQITAVVNGNTVSSLVVGGTGNTTTGVYGSGVGVWVVCLPVDTSFLHTNGSSNDVSVVIDNKTQGSSATAVFDSRSYYQALVTIAQDDSLNNTLDYAIAVGGGDIGQTSGGYTISRTLDLGDLGGGDVIEADLYAVYAYGDMNQKDAILLNGHSLLGDDVANAKQSGMTTYPNDFVHATVSADDLVAGDNLLKFTVDPSDFAAGSSLESSLRPQLAVLGVTHAVPEPSTIVMIILAGSALAMQFLLKRGIRQV